VPIAVQPIFPILKNEKGEKDEFPKFLLTSQIHFDILLFTFFIFGA